MTLMGVRTGMDSRFRVMDDLDGKTAGSKRKDFAERVCSGSFIPTVASTSLGMLICPDLTARVSLRVV